LPSAFSSGFFHDEGIGAFSVRIFRSEKSFKLSGVRESFRFVNAPRRKPGLIDDERDPFDARARPSNRVDVFL
jgi:hypothetical protein